MAKPRLSVLIASLGGGGAERVTSILLPFLAEAFETHLVLLEDVRVYPIPESVNVTVLGDNHADDSGWSKFAQLLPLARAYGAFCRTHRITTSFSLLNRGNYINILSRAFGNPGRILISERNTPSGEYSSNAPKDRISKALVRRLYPYADLIIPNSYGVRHDLEATYQIRTPMVTLHNPVDLKTIDRQLGQEPDLPPLEPGCFHLVNVGRLSSGKNQASLIRAVARLGEPRVRLHILGEGELREPLLELARDLHVLPQLRLHGFSKRPFSFLGRADAFVLSSSHEGFPNALIEALGCGLPAISTDCVGGPRELLAPDSDPAFIRRFGLEVARYGLLVPVGDVQALSEALRLILRDGALRQRLRLGARERAALLSVEQVARRFVETLGGAPVAAEN